MRLPTVLVALPVLLALSAGGASAQSPRPATGPVIRSAGPVFEIADPDFATPLDHTFRAVWEVRQSPRERDQVNPAFVNAARFLNMHARAGVPRERLRVAFVVHGPAASDLLDDAAYRERFGVANPNRRILEELAAAGARVILCGQSAAARDVPRDALLPRVEVALSAMTAMVVLQDEGYRLITW